MLQQYFLVGKSAQIVQSLMSSACGFRFISGYTKYFVKLVLSVSINSLHLI